jgi:hypothetical protein
MHIWTDLLAREGALLVILLALGAGPAAFLSDRIDAASRLALAPALGFCAGTCLATTVLEFVPTDLTYWMLVPAALLSLGIGAWRTRRSPGCSRSRARVRPRDAVQLLIVCVAVAGPLTYTLHEHHTVGPAAYTYTDVDGYVAEEDGAQTTSISQASTAWKRAAPTGARFADLTQLYWSFISSFNANPNSAPLDANVNGLLGLGATDTNSAFLIVLLLTGALGAFAAVRYATRSSTWMAVLAGALFGGPMFLELWFDTFEAAIITLGLLLPLAILGSELVRSRHAANFILFALVFACLLTVYPVLAPILALTCALVLISRGLALRRGGTSLRSLGRPVTTWLGMLVVLVVAFDNVSLVQTAGYYHKLLENAVPLPRVSWHLPLQVIPGWLLQTREFWYLPDLASSGFKQIVLGALIPLVFVGFIVIGVRRHRPTLALVALAGVCALVAEYSYASRDACTYCAERDLLPLAPIAIVLLTLGLAALLATPRGWVRALGVAGAALVVIAVAQRTHVELTRFSHGSYFLDSANRSVLRHLPPGAQAVELEGYGQTLSAQAEQPLAYDLVNEHARGRVSIVLGSDQNNAIEYLDFGAIRSPGVEFHPNYDYVLTRFAGVDTDRRVIARSGGIALEQRTQALDVTPYAGLEAPLARLDTTGTAWVQPGQPLELYVTGESADPVWIRLTFVANGPVAITPQAGLRFRQQGDTMIACVPTTGSAPIRQAAVLLTAPVVSGHVPQERFPPAVPLEGISLTAMRAIAGHCVI